MSEDRGREGNINAGKFWGERIVGGTGPGDRWDPSSTGSKLGGGGASEVGDGPKEGAGEDLLPRFEFIQLWW